MEKTLTVIFDGSVFRPESPPDLQPNTRYVIKVQDLTPTPSNRDAWDVLEELTGTINAPRDWSSEHDHYLYGTPKQHTESNE